jgi:undecaprenyl phosphate N,N'-diacetylbacillosamine 1-phosphate transferase
MKLFYNKYIEEVIIKLKLKIYQKYFKRPMDLVLSLIALIVLSPLLIIVAILVRIKLGSPVIFKQKRPGLNEKIFTLYKFRTMTDARDEIGELLPDSDRLSKFGKLLRRTSIDELPELFNILKGDMSIVGPRPLLIRYLPFYTDKEHMRHKVRPGLTGLAQISGRNCINWSERFSIDINYIDKITFANDFKIILLTTYSLLNKRDSINVENSYIFGDLDEQR